ncbi:hypothetical protein ACRE_073670 [Hapsidospora chrysogenum ATCC 11550]|uniref:Uncharacterized protein n=1 Tax=Hapsidospora chrysogenum (strain ATCC 11550 / CBS 779.69 / DSM 880 / IAM 14645 / JCM 23072 / IMI 49137) TaxID=857340 RepID=A0A086SXT9_HAPC1|nr:hypothetical protein ACRE_073670 [Hapsidospora chrysogenum ATCC 11550]
MDDKITQALCAVTIDDKDKASSGPDGDQTWPTGYMYHRLTPSMTLFTTFSKPVRIQWSPQDEHFASIFRAWEDEYSLPVERGAPISRIRQTLRKLESVLVPFGEAIQHSDTAFTEWRERHKAAMEAGLTRRPTWPVLRKGNPPRWQDHQWLKRYRYMNQQRKQLAFRAWEARFLFPED